MPLGYRLDAPVLHLVSIGDVDYAEGKLVFANALAAAATDGPGPWHLCFDLRRSTENRSTEEIEAIAAVVGSRRELLSGRVALVVAQPFFIGIANMFGAYVSRYGVMIAIFAEPESATAWLPSGKPVPGQDD